MTRERTHIAVTDQDVFDAMEREGGGFVAHLGAAWRRADRLNYEKLMTCFPRYYQEYFDRAKEARSRAS